MYESCCMQIMYSEQELIDDIFFMDLFECSFIDCVIEVCVHVLEDQIDVACGEGGKNLVEFDYVLMFDLFEDGDLTEGSLGISAVLEGLEYFFEGEELGWLI